MKPSVFTLSLCAVVMSALLWPTILFAATRCEPVVARIVSVQGNVEARRAGQTQWEPARLNDTYCAGDRIQVGERSRADVALVNQPVLRLDQESTITFGGVKEQRASVIEIIRGAIYFFSRLPRNLEIITAFANAGIEGTEGLVRVDADRTLISVFDGRVLATNQAGSLSISGGQSAVAERGRAPVLVVVARPRDAVQWALYYLPTLSFRAEEFQVGPAVEGAIRSSLEAYAKGDLQAAFESIKGVPDTVADPRFFAYRASLLLAVGRVDEASRDIDRALSLRPNYSDALALQAIVAVVQNEKEGALDRGRKAVAADLKSSSALVALSYAQQANFDLDGALASLQQAVQLNPENALAWARLAEMRLSFARLDEALEAAKRAVALNPNLSRTQTVLGFAYLTEVKTTEAKAAFEKAIELDQADSLPRLGLGLAKIREGDLEAGRSEIEIAVSLDPNSSILRSYLGKAYYEEKRIPADQQEYAIAKELDPKDPTPWFYDAIAKQTTNRPVEALQDMERAIELNDNRAVYRSRLLLDSDLAARSAALGRIYSDLGFQQLALVEGWKSVNTDPTNYSAHRFLADSYAVLPRHEIARVSELLQSQLLQPLNTTPIQPHLAESNLLLLSAQGPATLSFNEFNPLFTRNGVTFQTTGVAGERQTYAGEGVFSGIYNKAAFSLGGYRFQTNGWRVNSDQTDDIANAFLQLELTPQTSFQFEYRFRNFDAGDLNLNFFRQEFEPNLRVTAETESYRAGVRHAFSPNSVLLGSFMYQRRETLSHDAPPGFVRIDVQEPPQRGISGEIQHLFRSKYVNVTSGIGHFNLRREQVTTVEFEPPLDFLNAPPVISKLDARHTNIYLYSYLNLLRNVTFTAGGSGDFFNPANTDASERVHQFNPKFGVTWNPFTQTTIRAAAFRTFRRTLLTSQTLEPTQVAGFNQFFDDVETSRAWNYGVAVDQKFSKQLFGGVEWSHRDLNVPVTSIDPFTNEARLVRKDWREQVVRPYLFWTPHDWVALSGEYQYERIVRGSSSNFGLRDATTQRVPLGIRLFHPSGFGIGVKTTYVHQVGDFPKDGSCCESGRSDFWLVDTALQYRLPKRFGFVTVGASNLLDRHFKYKEIDFNNPTIQPRRTVFGKITLAF